MEGLLKVVPFFGILALIFAAYLAAKVSRQEEGTQRMKEIASAISEGARAFLMAEYKILVLFCTHFICADRPGNRKLDHSSMLCLRSFVFHPCRVLRNAGGYTG
mgnify:CR=1 FL=1